MPYCNDGDKPIIKYRFNNGNERIFKSEYAPIDVITRNIPAEVSNNYNKEGYEISFSSTQTFPSNYSTTVRDHFVFNNGVRAGYPKGENIVAYIPCEETWYRRRNPCNDDGYRRCLVWTLKHTSDTDPVVTVNLTKKCPSPASEKCSIEISYNNIIIHQSQGDCPCTFEVQCGKCKDGEIECKKSTYPGYCCVSCAEITEGIKAATAQLRSINNG